MRAVWLVILGACYQQPAIAPCTLTCDEAGCPDDLVCGSDRLCQTPGMPSCSSLVNSRVGVYVKAPTPEAGAQFGSSVAVSLDGSTLAVGAPMEANATGAVYVFAWTGSEYALDTRLTHSHLDDGDEFGASVALSADGNTLVIGAPFEDSNAKGLDGDGGNNATTDSGAVFLFTRSGGTWSSHYLKVGDGVTDHTETGASVDVSADGAYVAVGAPGDANTPGNTSGYAYLWDGASVTRNFPAKAEIDDRVGISVAIGDDGGHILVGADHEDSDAVGYGGNASSNLAPDSGAIDLLPFEGEIGKPYFKPSNTGVGDQFGASVDCSSTADVLAAGAPFEDSSGDELDNSATDSGAVYVFDRPTQFSWAQRQYLKAPTIAAGDNFGQSLSLAPEGTLIVVGAPGTASRAGAAYVFEQIEGVWQARATLEAPNADAGDALGTSVAVSRDHLVFAVGAPHEASASEDRPHDNSAPDAGAVYVFR